MQIAKTDKTDKKSVFVFDQKNCFIILEMMKIFGMLSPSHKADTIAIIDTIQNFTAPA